MKPMWDGKYSGEGARLTPSQKREVRKTLDKVYGRPPHNVPSNLCYGDGYVVRSLEKKYGMSEEQLKKEIGYR